MTEQEAIETLQKEYPLRVSWYEDLCDAYGMAISALQKQTPVKPTTNRKYPSLYFCPKCGEYIGAWTDVNYCPNCGQHLLWEDVE